MKDVRSLRIRRFGRCTGSHPRFIARDTQSLRKPATIATIELKLFSWKHFCKKKKTLSEGVCLLIEMKYSAPKQRG